MNNFQLVLEVQAHFESIRALDRQFSQRKFAKLLGLKSSELSEFLRGKRLFSANKAMLVIEKLAHNSQDKASIYRKVFLESKGDNALEISQEVFLYISNPDFYTFLQLVNTPDFRHDISWISKRLDLEDIEIKKIIIKLKTLKLIGDCPIKGLKRIYHSVRTSEDVESSALKAHHLNDLKTIEESIIGLPVSQRDLSSLTFLFDLADFDKAKEILRRAQDEIEALGGGKSPRQVFKVSTYLYPMTNLDT
jgi:transcriptional regulator with XRE-family HTH domain